MPPNCNISVKTARIRGGRGVLARNARRAASAPRAPSRKKSPDSDVFGRAAGAPGNPFSHHACSAAGGCLGHPRGVAPVGGRGCAKEGPEQMFHVKHLDRAGGVGGARLGAGRWLIPPVLPPVTSKHFLVLNLNSECILLILCCLSSFVSVFCVFRNVLQSSCYFECCVIVCYCCVVFLYLV